MVRPHRGFGAQVAATPCAKRAALQRKRLGGNRRVGTHAAVSKSPHIFASSAVRYASETTRSRAYATPQTVAVRVRHDAVNGSHKATCAVTQPHLLLLPASLRQLHLLQVRICRPRGRCARHRGRCRSRHRRPSPPPELPARHWCTHTSSERTRQRVTTPAFVIGCAPGDGASGSKQAYTAGSSARAGASGSGQAYTLSDLLGAAQTMLTRGRVARALRAPGAQQC